MKRGAKAGGDAWQNAHRAVLLPALDRDRTQLSLRCDDSPVYEGVAVVFSPRGLRRTGKKKQGI